GGGADSVQGAQEGDCREPVAVEADGGALHVRGGGGRHGARCPARQGQGAGGGAGGQAELSALHHQGGDQRAQEVAVAERVARRGAAGDRLEEVLPHGRRDPGAVGAVGGGAAGRGPEVDLRSVQG